MIRQIRVIRGVEGRIVRGFVLSRLGGGLGGRVREEKGRLCDEMR